MHRLPAISRLAVVIAMAGFATTDRTASGQAWPQPRGEAYVKLSRSWVDAADRYDLSGDRVPYAADVQGTAFQDRSHYLYAEYGATNRLTVVGLVPVKRLTVRTPDGLEHTSTGLGSLMAGVRVGLRETLGLKDSPISAAGSFLVSLPAGYQRNAVPAVGPGQVDVQGSFSVGASFYPLPAYAQAAAGYRLRSGIFGLSSTCTVERPDCLPDERPDFDDEWLLKAELGAFVSRFAFVQFLFQGVYSNSPPSADFVADNPNALRQRFTKVGFGLTLYPVPYLGLSAQYFATPAGKNTIASNDYFVGLEYLLRRSVP